MLSERESYNLGHGIVGMILLNIGMTLLIGLIDICVKLFQTIRFMLRPCLKRKKYKKNRKITPNQ